LVPIRSTPWGCRLRMRWPIRLQLTASFKRIRAFHNTSKEEAKAAFTMR
jgi:hypothetical protein